MTSFFVGHCWLTRPWLQCTLCSTSQPPVDMCCLVGQARHRYLADLRWGAGERGTTLRHGSGSQKEKAKQVMCNSCSRLKEGQAYSEVQGNPLKHLK